MKLRSQSPGSTLLTARPAMPRFTITLIPALYLQPWTYVPNRIEREEMGDSQLCNMASSGLGSSRNTARRAVMGFSGKRIFVRSFMNSSYIHSVQTAKQYKMVYTEMSLSHPVFPSRSLRELLLKYFLKIIFISQL